MGNEQTLHVGCAAGFSGDRTDAAGPVVDTLIRLGGPAVLIFETLAERTLALAQLARRSDPEAGYEPLLVDMLSPVLERALEHRIRIVSNFGAANPQAAARRILALAQQLGCRIPKIAVVEGDDVSSDDQRAALLERLGDAGEGLAIASANAYLGAEAIAAALREGADVVVTGRVSDPSLTVGPALAHFGWALDEWDCIAGATMAGHLLECGAQVCGGYYADPGFKDVPDLARVGYPIASLQSDGSCTLIKSDGSGGCIDEHTVKEQLLYELHDPAAYLTPDVVADITKARVDGVGPDAVRLSGVKGHARPATLKVNVFHEHGWLSEGEISYAGRGAEARARLAAKVLGERLAACGPLRVDLIGVASSFGDDAGRWLAAQPEGSARDVRLRVAMNHADRSTAERLPREVTALYTCGPAGGGGVRTQVRLRPRHGVVQRAARDGAAALLVLELKGPAMTHEPTRTVPLYRAAHGRTGDKGNRSNISVIAWHADLYPSIALQITEAAVAAQFAHRQPSRVTRYLLPHLHAMNFVLDDALDGGVNDSLNLDSHGKALSFLLLDLPLRVPERLLALLRGPSEE